MALRLEGRIAVVTGGTNGIGLATARRFATEGARVFVTGRRQAELDAAVAAIGPRATGVQAESANPGDLNRLYERVKTEAGRIDVLFVNAGGGSMLPWQAPTQRSSRACSTIWPRPSRSGASVIPMTSPAPPSSPLPRTQASSPKPNSSSTADKPRSEQTAHNSTGGCATVKSQ